MGSSNLRSQSIGAGLKIQMEGDWTKVSSIINNLSPDIKAAYIAGQMSAAKKFKKLILSYIGTTGKSLNWPAVSVGYAVSKISKGGDPSRMLFLSGTYKRSIQIRSRGTNIRVGIDPRARNEEGYRVIDYAAVLEYGSDASNIQARPLWEPAFREFGGKARIKKIILYHLSQTYLLKYGYKPKIKF